MQAEAHGASRREGQACIPGRLPSMPDSPSAPPDCSANCTAMVKGSWPMNDTVYTWLTTTAASSECSLQALSTHQLMPRRSVHHESRCCNPCMAFDGMLKCSAAAQPMPTHEGRPAACLPTPLDSRVLPGPQVPRGHRHNEFRKTE